jgi:hypothetical protein
MNGTAVFEGRPVNGVIAHMLLGSATGFLAVLFLWLTAVYNNPLPPGMIFSVLATIFLATAARRLRKRQVVVDGSCVTYFVGRALRWSIPWMQVRSVGNRRHMAGASTACIFLRTDGGELRLTDGTDFGPEKKLQALFVFLASRARERKVSVVDNSLWLVENRHPPRSLEDRMTGTWQLELPQGIRTADYSNRWLGCDTKTDPILIGLLFLVCAGPISALGLLCLITGYIPALLSWIIILLPPLLFGVLITGIYKMAIVKVFFDGERITLLRNTGRQINIPWSKVSRCRYDRRLKQLELFVGIGNYSVFLDTNSMMAVCKRYSEATRRPAYVYYSPPPDTSGPVGC